MNSCNTNNASKVIAREELDALFSALRSRGYTIIGPAVRDGAIVYEEISGTDELPVGWRDVQSPGSYRLERRGDGALFGYVVGPHSWKKYLFPPVQRLYRVTRNGQELSAVGEDCDSVKRAFIGVRGCELSGIAVQDKVFEGGSFFDPHYRSRRANVFLVAVNCGQAAATCFCTSMGTGPGVQQGFDLALTEFLSEGAHEFFVEAGSEPGAEVLKEIAGREAIDEDCQRRDRILRATSQQIQRTMETSDLKELLYRNHEHARWNAVAERCLSCANCTLVCPTCFCSTVEDVTDLSGDHAERWRKWDSCFTMDFSYLGGGNVRATTKARYRQWMTHKLGTWQDQFGMLGCVGCGRCITWCPVGIDITEEAAAIRESEKTVAVKPASGEQNHERS